MSTLLTAADVLAFAAQLRATVALAEEGQRLKELLGALHLELTADLGAGAEPSVPAKRARSARRARAAAPAGVTRNALRSEPASTAPAATASAPAARTPSASPSVPPHAADSTAGARAGEITEEAVLSAIGGSSAGLAIRELVSALAGGEQTIRRRVLALEARGVVRRVGESRSTRYLLASAAPPAFLPSVAARPATAKVVGHTPAAAEAPPAAPAPAPRSAASGAPNLVDEVRAALHAVYTGVPVKADVVARKLGSASVLVDAALMLLLKSREVKAVGKPGRFGYIPVGPAPSSASPGPASSK
jgi:hypothetical protein